MTSTIAAAGRTSRRHRMLLPMATLLAAVSIAGVSGATFNDATANPLSTYATGSFDLVNSRDGSVIFNTTNLKPGDTVTGSVLITNDSSMPALVTAVETDGPNTFPTRSMLQMVVKRDGTQIFAGNFGDWDGFAAQRWLQGEFHTYDFAVTLSADATKENEAGKTAQVAYAWNAVQTDAETYDGQTVGRANNG